MKLNYKFLIIFLLQFNISCFFYCAEVLKPKTINFYSFSKPNINFNFKDVTDIKRSKEFLNSFQAALYASLDNSKFHQKDICVLLIPKYFFTQFSKNRKFNSEYIVQISTNFKEYLKKQKLVNGLVYIRIASNLCQRIDFYSGCFVKNKSFALNKKGFRNYLLNIKYP